jgi:flagellar protein FlaI
LLDIKKLRGALYRRSEKKKALAPKTRAGKMLYILKKRYPDFQRFKIYPSKPLRSIPTATEMKTSGMVYPLIKPYAYASVHFDSVENTLVYDVIEPRLRAQEKDMYEQLKEGLIQVINVKLEDVTKEQEVMTFLEDSIRSLIKQLGFKIGEESYAKIMYYIFRDFMGLNEIEPLLRDPYIEDIGCDGVNIPIYVIHQKFGSLRTNIIYNDNTKLTEFVTKLAERCDRYISYAEPLLDGTLPDGTRVQASLASDVTTHGPTFSIRKFREIPFTPIDLVRLNTISSEMLAYLWFTIENGINILIVGGVATGKTSMLNSLTMFIPTEAKIISIEDTRELNIPHENWIPGVARTGFTSTGVGEVTMFDLLKESFRQNPDYLVVGEIRGKEAYVMFQGMASGHPSLSTMHGGSVDDLIKRLQTKPINLSPGLLESLDMVIVMVHARERGKSARRVRELVEIEGIDISTGNARTVKSFVWVPSQDIFEYRGNSWVIGKIASQKGLPLSEAMREISRRKKIINWMLENNITTMHDVVKYINLYHRSPEKFERVIKKGSINIETEFGENIE